MSARGDFREYCEGLRRRLDRGGTAITDQERSKLLALRDVWEKEYQRDPGGSRGGVFYIAQRPPSRESVEAEFGSTQRREKLSRPRRRPPDPIPLRDIE